MKNPFAKPAAVTRHLKIAVTGKSGTGKTVFGLDAKNHGLGRVAIISNEAGDVHYIVHPKWGDFDRLPTQSIGELEQAISYLEQNPTEYGTLVLDTITGVYEALVGAKAKDDGSVNVKAWGLIKRKWRSLMARINNLPVNVIAVVHENDIVEQDSEGKSKVVGQKLDAEKTFERNPDVLVRLIRKSIKPPPGISAPIEILRQCEVLKDRTGTFQAGQVVDNPNLGMWAKAIKTGATQARVSLPEEVDRENEAAIDASGDGHRPSSTTTRPAEAPEQIAARLIADCAHGWRDWQEKRAWSEAHRPEKLTLSADLQEQVRLAFVAAHPVNKPTNTGKAIPAAA